MKSHVHVKWSKGLGSHIAIETNVGVTCILNCPTDPSEDAVECWLGAAFAVVTSISGESQARRVMMGLARKVETHLKRKSRASNKPSLRASASPRENPHA
jgi:hypothetical protein